MTTNLMTPAEFVEAEFESLKEFLNSYDIQVNKVGLIGYLINLLGNIKFDSQTYYQELFKNAFIPTTIDMNSLYLHSAIYNYIPNKATPSIAIGTINFDFGLLSSPGNDIIKRQIVLKNIKFQNDKVQFYSDTQYTFIEEQSNGQFIYYAVITTSDGQIEYVSSPSSYISVPFKNIKQYSFEEEIISIPNYEYGTYYSLTIDTNDKYLFDLEVGVRLADKQYNTNDDYDSLNIEYISYLSNPEDMSCFLKPIDPKTWDLKLGSGLHGRYMPNSQLKIKKYLTYGEISNILVSSKVFLSTDTEISTFYTSITNGEIEKNLNLNSVFELNFSYSYGGKNSSSETELREKLINYIQTRNTLINKKDFYNLEYEKESEFVYSFRKSMIQQNTFFLYKLILDQYKKPVKCLCNNIPVIDVTNQVNNIVITQEQNSSGQLQDGVTYKYVIRASDGFNYSTASNAVQLTISNPNNTIKLSWDSFPDAEYYVISVTTDDINYKYYQTRNTECYDFGDNFQDSTLSFGNADYIYYPEYVIDGETFISPFIYKYNEHMKWYDGYLFYDSFTVYFTKVESNDPSQILPICYFQIEYDIQNRKTILTAKSYQDISTYQLKVSLSDSSFVDEDMTMIDANTFTIEYSPQYPNIIDGEHKIILVLYDSTNNVTITLTSASFFQIKKITDQLFLPIFKNDNNKEYILNIPLINLDEYNANRSFYDNIFSQLFYEDLISTKRFPCDNIQCRLLNTYKLPANITKHNTIQEYNFDLKMPLKLSINILLNRQYIIDNQIDLQSEQDDLYLQIAQELQDKYTGTDIKYYTSKLIEFIHYSREYIKQVSIEVKDSNNNIISNGLELIPEQDTIYNIQDDGSFSNTEKKINILNYFPIYIHWDLDNINIDYRFEF